MFKCIKVLNHSKCYQVLNMKKEITKYETPMQRGKQHKSTVPESKRVKYVDTLKTKIIQHVPSLTYEMEVVTSNRHVSN